MFVTPVVCCCNLRSDSLSLRPQIKFWVQSAFGSLLVIQSTIIFDRLKLILVRCFLYSKKSIIVLLVVCGTYRGYAVTDYIILTISYNLFWGKQTGLFVFLINEISETDPLLPRVSGILWQIVCRGFSDCKI